MSTAVDPNSVGGEVLSEVGSHGGIRPNEVTLKTQETPAEPVAQPDTPAPKEGDLDYGDIDITKLSPAEQKTAKQFQAAFTKARQKDADAVRTAQTELQQLGWARDLSRLMASPDPGDRQKGAQILRASLHVLEPSPTETPPDPLASMDWESVEAVAPGLPKAFQHLRDQVNSMQEQLGGAVQTTTTLAQARADEALGHELATVKTDAEKAGLPFDEARVLKTAIDRGIKDVRDAYHAAYGLELVEAGKQAALKGLATKKAAALPGAGPAAGVTETRPKFKTMHEAYAWAKRERGITGELT